VIFWGAHASRRAGFGVAPKRTFRFSRSGNGRVSTEVHDREGALASTRNACAPRNPPRDLVEVRRAFALNLWNVTRF
jgi:hypothetical protein